MSDKETYRNNKRENYRRDGNSPNENLNLLKIKELDLDMINPSTKTYMNPKQGGSKIVVIGKPGTGKSTLIESILYFKKHIFPVAMVFSGTEDSNGFYQRIIPSTFIFNKYDEDKIKQFIKRQKIAKKHIENPWGYIIVDDCTDDPKIFNKPLQQGMYKEGRHWKMMYILSLQYCMDVRPSIRTNVDGTFILRESNLRNRKSLWENYAGCIPDFTTFCALMDALTSDYTALYIHNATQTNDWKECVFWYKAKPIPSGFKVGCPEYWDFHKQRFNENYVAPFI